MTPHWLIAIDPGASGGIVVDCGVELAIHKMPETRGDIIDLLEVVRDNARHQGVMLRAYIEHPTGYIPGNRGDSAVKFAKSCERVEAICETLRIPMTLVSPQKWQKPLGALPKEYNARKRAIKGMMQMEYPSRRKEIIADTADALALLRYAQKQEGAGR